MNDTITSSDFWIGTKKNKMHSHTFNRNENFRHEKIKIFSHFVRSYECSIDWIHSILLTLVSSIIHNFSVIFEWQSHIHYMLLICQIGQRVETFNNWPFVVEQECDRMFSSYRLCILCGWYVRGCAPECTMRVINLVVDERRCRVSCVLCLMGTCTIGTVDQRARERTHAISTLKFNKKSK